MKNLMRILSILIALTAILLLVTSYVNISNDVVIISRKLSNIVEVNLLPIMSIALCAYCLERNDSNYLTRIIPLYMTVPIVLMIIGSFIEVGSSVSNVFSNIISVMSGTYPCITLLSLLFIVKPNNTITKFIKFIAYAAIAINIILAITIQVKSYMVKTLPNVYEYDDYGGFNFTTVTETKSFANKVYSASLIIESFAIILLFTTNYAFSETIELDTEDIDYEALKKEAFEMTNKPVNNVYQEAPLVVEKAPDRSQSNKGEKGLMNISNQLGNDSNVGKVEKAAPEVNIAGSSMEDIMPLSMGPVINETLQSNHVQNNTQQMQQPQQVQQMPQMQQTQQMQQMQQPQQPQQIQQMPQMPQASNVPVQNVPATPEQQINSKLAEQVQQQMQVEQPKEIPNKFLI